MNSTVQTLLKIGVIVLYVATLASLFLGSLAAYSTILLYITAALAVAHMGEYALFNKRIRKLPGSKAGHFINTLLYGFIYWLPLFKEHKV